jgi:hypothetical protein
MTTDFYFLHISYEERTYIFISGIQNPIYIILKTSALQDVMAG